MAESPFRQRRFRPDEVRSVLRRAATDTTDDAGSVTREDLETHLRGLGLSPSAVKRAMEAESDVAEEDADGSWAGGPRRLLFEGAIDGELPEERWEDVVEVIREEMGDTGRVEGLGKSLTWTPTVAMNNQQRRLAVRIRMRDGKTRIRVEEDLYPVRVGAWVGMGVGGGFGLGTLGIAVGFATKSFLLGVSATLLIVAASLLGAWAITRAISKSRKRRLRILFEKLEDEVRRSNAAAPPPKTTKKKKRIAPRAEPDEAEREAEAEAEADAEDEARAR